MNVNVGKRECFINDSLILKDEIKDEINDKTNESDVIMNVGVFIFETKKEIRWIYLMARVTNHNFQFF